MAVCCRQSANGRACRRDAVGGIFLRCDRYCVARVMGLSRSWETEIGRRMGRARGLSSDFLRDPGISDSEEGGGAKALEDPSASYGAGLGDAVVGEPVDDLVDILYADASLDRGAVAVQHEGRASPGRRPGRRRPGRPRRRPRGPAGWDGRRGRRAGGARPGTKRRHRGWRRGPAGRERRCRRCPGSAPSSFSSCRRPTEEK